MISAISVKDRLKNQAVTSGKTFQEALTAYGLERTVYRLSVSEYMERFTLKGGIFLYALLADTKIFTIFISWLTDMTLTEQNLRKQSEKPLSIEVQVLMISLLSLKTFW